MTTGHNLT